MLECKLLPSHEMTFHCINWIFHLQLEFVAQTLFFVTYGDIYGRVMTANNFFPYTSPEFSTLEYLIDVGSFQQTFFVNIFLYVSIFGQNLSTKLFHEETESKLWSTCNLLPLCTARRLIASTCSFQNLLQKLCVTICWMSPLDIEIVCIALCPHSLLTEY